MASVVENVHFRTTAAIKQKIADAAALQGLSITTFIETAAVERAAAVLAQQTLVLTDAERDRFLEAIDNPLPPPPALVAAAERAMRAVREGRLDP